MRELGKWRVGGKVPLNVYEGERPMFQCHTPEDAARIVGLLNEGDAERLEKLWAVAHAARNAVGSLEVPTTYPQSLWAKRIREALAALGPLPEEKKA